MFFGTTCLTFSIEGWLCASLFGSLPRSAEGSKLNPSRSASCHSRPGASSLGAGDGSGDEVHPCHAIFDCREVAIRRD